MCDLGRKITLHTIHKDLLDSNLPHNRYIQYLKIVTKKSTFKNIFNNALKFCPMFVDQILLCKFPIRHLNEVHGTNFTNY